MHDIGVYKLNSSATIPNFATEESACFDLRCSLENVESVKSFGRNNIESKSKVLYDAKEQESYVIVEPGSRMLIPTGLVFALDKGYSIRLHPRSSFSLKKGLTLANAEGIIDSDYYNETFIAILNVSNTREKIYSGDRVCQGEVVISNTVEQIHFEELDIAPSQRTQRIGGFGSTGTK